MNNSLSFKDNYSELFPRCWSPFSAHNVTPSFTGAIGFALCYLRTLMWVRHPRFPPSFIGECLWIKSLVFWQEGQPVSRCHINYGIRNFFFRPDFTDEYLQWWQCHHPTEQNLLVSSVGLCNHRNMYAQRHVKTTSLLLQQGTAFTTSYWMKCKNKYRQFLKSSSCVMVFSKICMLARFVLMLEVYIKIIWNNKHFLCQWCLWEGSRQFRQATWLPGTPVLDD